MMHINCLFMVMRIKIVWDQPADRAGRLSFLLFAPFSPAAVVCSTCRVIGYAHFPGSYSWVRPA